MGRFWEMLPKIAVAAVVLGGVALVISKMSDGAGEPGKVPVTVPALSAQGQKGQVAFTANCAACHGENGSGTLKGPPLIHDTYNPGHHPDGSIFNAIRKGVQSHHWSYGNMPAQRQVTKSTAADIIGFIRELQKANGITYREHRM